MPYKKETLPLSEAESLRVLCAEDDPNMAFILKRSLVRFGHFVECAQDGQEAVERMMANKNFYDVVITDHNMPRKNGLELVRSLREAGYIGRLIIHCSTLAEQDAEAYRALKVDHMFEKALQSNALIKLVATFTRTPS